MTRIGVAIAFVGLAVLAASANAQPLAATSLRLEYAESPLYGLDVPNPRFSWLIQSTVRSTAQSAYQVFVSQSPNPQQGEVWNSGKVAGNATSQIVFAGTALLSDTTYYWNVVWWDAKGNQAPASAVFVFHTGFLRPADWSASQWIGGFNQLRKEFLIIGAAPTEATLFICGIGYHEVFLNGQKVGTNKLDPGWTQYTTRSYYVAHDVTALLQSDENAIGVMLGNGWYGQGDNAPPRLLFQLTVKRGNATSYIVSDLSWKGAPGPITYDSVYNGETYDARLEQPGWTLNTFDDSAWSAAKSMPAPGGLLSAQLIPPIRVLATLPPLSIANPQPGVYVVDFGQNLAGWTQLSVTGPAGTNVTLRHAEILQHDGSGMIYTDNLRTAKATDVYTLKGAAGGEVYQPRFTYHGFRFVEVTGFPGTPTLGNFMAVHVGSSVTPVGQAAFNQAVLDQIQHNILWGQQDNLMSVPTDCCQRDERLGWMADGHLSSEEAIHNYFMPGFYSAWIRLMTDDQQNGAIPDTVPHMRYGSEPGDPSWSAAFPLLVSYVHGYYDDARLLQSNYAQLSAYFQFMYGKVQQSGIGSMFAYYGDWVPPPPQPKCSGSFTSAWFFLVNLQQFIDIAQALNQTADVAKWTPILQQLQTQFTAAFYNPSTHNFDIGVQTSLSLGLLTPQLIPGNDFVNVSINLLNDIANKGTHLTTGIIGTKYLMEALTALGRDDVGLELALQTTYPSWGYMHFNPVETPATTLWELWDSPFEGPGMNSRNHIMFGSIGKWFHASLVGIRQQPGTRGYKHFLIQPPTANVLANSALSSASGQLEFMTGQVSVSWQRSGGVQCAVGPEHANVTLSCGPGSKISSIQFASFGLPSGVCGAYAENVSCHASTSLSVVESLCVGQESCLISALDTVFGDPCYGEYKTLSVQAVCSTVPTFTLETNIPSGTDAEIHVSKISLGNVVVSESGSVVWKNNAFVPGVAGLTSASDNGAEIVFQAGSGGYNFQVTGNPGAAVCANVSEHSALALSCPESSQRVTLVQFASFGTPTVAANGPCAFSLGSCHAGSSKHMIEQACLGKNACTVLAEDWVFGDPCYGTVKNLAAAVICA